MTIEQLNEKYGFKAEDHEKAYLNGGQLHPVYKRHLKTTFLIECVYGLQLNEKISMGKARELVSAIIEEQFPQPPPDSEIGEQKTLEQFKNEVAKQAGAKDFNNLAVELAAIDETSKLELYIDHANKLFYKQQSAALAKRNEELEEACEKMFNQLKENSRDMLWMWENLDKPHTSDHFNTPANAIQSTNELISHYEELIKKNGKG